MSCGETAAAFAQLLISALSCMAFFGFHNSTTKYFLTFLMTPSFPE